MLMKILGRVLGDGNSTGLSSMSSIMKAENEADKRKKRLDDRQVSIRRSMEMGRANILSLFGKG